MGDGAGVAFVSGLLAGFVTTVTLHPLDVIKTRFQVDEAAGRDAIWRRLTGQPPDEALTSRKIHAEAGFRGLYRGVMPAIVGSSTSWGIYFLLYEGMKKGIAEWNVSRGGLVGEKLHSSQYLGASALAGAMTTLCTNPVWLIKTRMELQRPGHEPYRGFAHAFKTIIREEGIVGLYKGIVPALILVSNGGVQFMIYEELKIWLDRELSATDYFVLGAVSKSVASTITYPYQVVKSRMQQHSSKYATTTFTFRRIIQKQGFLALYRGLGPNLLRVMPSSAITFATYELTKKQLSSLSPSS